MTKLNETFLNLLLCFFLILFCLTVICINSTIQKKLKINSTIQKRFLFLIFSVHEWRQMFKCYKYLMCIELLKQEVQHNNGLCY